MVNDRQFSMFIHTTIVMHADFSTHFTFHYLFTVFNRLLDMTFPLGMAMGLHLSGDSEFVHDAKGNN